jgi:hypothetical protein
VPPGSLAWKHRLLEKIENAIGTKEMLQLFAKIGKGVGEDSFVDGSRSTGFGMSPEAARVRIGQLKGDREWSAKYLGRAMRMPRLRWSA